MKIVRPVETDGRLRTLSEWLRNNSYFVSAWKRLKNIVFRFNVTEIKKKNSHRFYNDENNL